MRSNEDRSGAHSFDASADQYDRARPAVPAAVVSRMLELAGLGAGDRVLEVGAGSGQLTRGLLQAGIRVHAVEPSRGMAELLEQRCGDSLLEITVGTLDDAPLEHGAFRAVLGANVFHWLDPATAYARTAELVEPAGVLVQAWVHPIAVDDAIQAAITQATAPLGLPEGVPLLASDLPSTDARQAAGRAEVEASGLWSIRHHDFDHERIDLASRDFAEYMATFVPAAPMPDAQLDDVAAAIDPILAAHGLEAVPLVLRWYCVVADLAGT